MHSRPKCFTLLPNTPDRINCDMDKCPSYQVVVIFWVVCEFLSTCCCWRLRMLSLVVGLLLLLPWSVSRVRFTVVTSITNSTRLLLASGSKSRRTRWCRSLFVSVWFAVFTGACQLLASGRASMRRCSWRSFLVSVWFAVIASSGSTRMRLRLASGRASRRRRWCRSSRHGDLEGISKSVLCDYIGVLWKKHPAHCLTREMHNVPHKCT